MAFRFLHTADWHIGKSFGGFPAEKRALLGDARLSVIERIVDVARSLDIAHVLVAGDVFDSPKLADSVIRQTMHRLGQAKDVTWYLLPGNHDPAVERGIWERVENLGRPPNVTICRTAELISIRQDVVLFTAPVTNARTMQDPTAHFGELMVQDGTIRIGLAHGSVQQFGSGNEEEASVLIAADRAEQDGLDYLALGDWHGQKTITDRTSYSGTPEPESFVDNQPGFVLSVTVDGAGAIPRVERRSTGLFSWSRMEFAFDGLATPATLLAGLHEIRDNGLRNLLRVKLAGDLSLEEGVGLRAQLDALGDVIFHMETNWDNVQLTVREADHDLFVDDRLSALAEKLQSEHHEPNDAEGRVRQRALQILARLAASSRGRQAHVD